MKYTTLVVLVFVVACGSSRDPRFTQSNQLGAGQLTISGFVSMVQVTTAGTNAGPNSVVTVVTFVPPTPQAGPVGTVTFCGNVANSFVVSTFATARLTQGQGCSNLIDVTT